MIHQFQKKCAILVLLIIIAVLAAPIKGAVSASANLRGYSPEANVTWVSLTLTNPMSYDAECRLEFSGYGRGVDEATVNLPPLPPGASRTYNLAVPLVDFHNATLHERNEPTVHLGLTTSRYGSAGYRGFVHVADTANMVNEAELDEFTVALHPEVRSFTHSSTSGTTPSLSDQERIISQMPPEQLPENWLCYSPLRTLIMTEASERRLTSPQKNALDTWLHLGGRLVVYGQGQEETTSSLGAGQIVRTVSNPLQTRMSGQLKHDVPFISTWDGISSSAMPYQENRAGGRGGAFILTTLFLIVVGPINYLYFARRGQIRKLILSVPIISIAFCSVIGIYFILTQGFNRKGGSMSVTWLDEASDRAVTFARHSLLSGLYPMGGFRYSPETYIVPRQGEDSSGLVIDISRELHLTDGLFQPGIPFNYTTVRPVTTRERMVYNETEDSIRNGFQIPVKSVSLLRDGRYYRGGPAEPGAPIALSAVDAAEVPGNPVEVTVAGSHIRTLVRLLGQQQLSTTELEAVAELSGTVGRSIPETSGTMYAVWLDGKPEGLESGLDITEGQNLHVLVGVLPLEATGEEQ